MMRKIIVIALVAAIGAAGVYFAYDRMQKTAHIDNIETIVPYDAVYYFYSNNPSQKVEDFRKSDFFGKLENSKFYQNFVSENIQKKQVLFDNLSEIFKKDTAFVSFSLQLFLPRSKILKEFNADVGSFLVFVRMSPKQNIKKMLGEAYLQLSEEENVIYRTYKSVRIITYSLPSQLEDKKVSLSYAQVKDILVLGDDINRIKDVIDLSKDSSIKSLADNDAYQQLVLRQSQKKDKVLLWSFVNYDALNKKIKEFIAKNTVLSTGHGSIIPAFIRDISESILGILTIVDYDKSKRGLLVKTYQLFDKSKGDNNFFKVFARDEGSL